MYFIPLINFVQPEPGKIFYDLGCGAGKPLITASLAFPNLKVCKGMELLSGLADLAKSQVSAVIKQCEKNSIKIAPIEVV